MSTGFRVQSSGLECLVALTLYALTLHAPRAASAQTGTLTYPLKDNVDLRHGTIECWVQFAVNVEDYLPVKDFQTIVVLFAFEGEKGSMAASHFVGSIFGAKNGGWYFRPGPKPMMLPVSAAAIWKKGDWHHIAVTWKEKLMTLYLDGKQAGYRDQQSTLEDAFAVVTDQRILFGDKWHVAGRFIMDDLRISNIARTPGELGFAAGELKVDPFTLLLDPFEGDFVPDGKQKTRPRTIMVGEGGLVTAPSVFVTGKFGKALAFGKP